MSALALASTLTGCAGLKPPSLQVEALNEAAGPVLRGPILRGPGIEDSRRFNADPLPPGFWAQARANHAGFPRGVDILFAAPGQLTALPRSTRLESA